MHADECTDHSDDSVPQAPRKLVQMTQIYGKNRHYDLSDLHRDLVCSATDAGNVCGQLIEVYISKQEGSRPRIICTSSSEYVHHFLPGTSTYLVQQHVRTHVHVRGAIRSVCTATQIWELGTEN